MYIKTYLVTHIGKKRMVRCQFLLLSIILILTLLVSGCQSKQEIVNNSIATGEVSTDNARIIRLANGNWPPYNGEFLVEGGCDSQVIKETFALAGYEVEYGYFPWARSYSLSATGEWDGTLAWDDTPTHRKDHWISAQPTSVQQWVFFYRKSESFSWESMNDLHGKTIGITTGYVYSDAFTNLPEDSVTFIESTTDDANFKMLLAGRIDVFPMEKEVGLYLINQNFSTEEQNLITFADKAFSEFNSHLLLSKAIPENEKRIKEFDTAFRKLMDNGRYEEIMLHCGQIGD